MDSYKIGLVYNKNEIERIGFILGEFYLKNKEYAPALPLFKNAINYFTEENDLVMKGFANGYLGVAQIGAGHLDRGIRSIEFGETLMGDVKMNSDKRGYYELITDIAYEKICISYLQSTRSS